jgi:hypothetical protein
MFVNGMGSPQLKSLPDQNILNGSPKSPRKETNGVRPGTPQRYVSAPVLPASRDHEIDGQDVEDLRSLPVPSLTEEELTHDEVEEQDTDEHMTDDLEEVDEQRPPPVEVRKSAWELLWDDLADFAGIHDPDDE